MRFLKYILAVLILTSCGASVRDPEVYKSEIDFLQAASDEQVERGIELIHAKCKCADVFGVKVFETKACQDFAETLIVVKYRVKYHTDFMLYLGGLTEERPPEYPPEIPDATELCLDTSEGIDAGADASADAGVDGGAS